MSGSGIWLLFGLPVTRDEYDERMMSADTPEGSDYLARFDDPDLSMEARLDHRREEWCSDYSDNISGPLQELADRARALGCEVRRAATLADLRAAAESAGVIIVYSHWKGAGFSADDFLRSVDSTIGEPIFLVDRDAPARLAAVDGPLAAWLKQAMAGRPGRWLGFARKPPMTAREAVRRCIDAPIASRPPPGIQAVHELPTTTASRRRDCLDRWLAGCIRPGNRLELFDGLWGQRALGLALNGFEGVLDLSACTTTYLGDRLGHAAGHGFHTVQFLEPQYPAEAAIRLGIVLEISGGDPDNYLMAREQVAQVFPRAVEQEMARRRLKTC